MSKEDVETERVKLHRESPSDESQIMLDQKESDVYVVVTQIYCPEGHNLVGLSQETFDGFPGISLWVELGDQAGEVVVSPIHGDSSKKGLTFPEGAKLSLKCPVCKTELPELTRCGCADKGQLRKLYLTPALTEAHLVAVCDIWGCQLSRVIDSYEMFSEFLAGNIGDGDE